MYMCDVVESEAGAVAETDNDDWHFHPVPLDVTINWGNSTDI
jgi:hypothetical protein